MNTRYVKQLLRNIYCTKYFLNREEPYRNYMHSVFNRLQLQRSKADKVEKDKLKEEQESCQLSLKSNVKKDDDNYGVSKYSSDEEDSSDSKWKLELAWLTKALEPALQFCRWALPTGDGIGNKPPPNNRSLTEIIAYIQRSKIGIQDWSLSDLTIGLYLIYLRQASTHPFEDIKCIQIAFKILSIILSWLKVLIRIILQFFQGTACFEKGFRLRLVGHSLGGAIASLLAIMIHRKSSKELGFSPNIVSAVGYGTPPCVSKELAESCAGYVTTVVMQDDIIPRLSVASLTRLRNEILQTDWMSVIEKEDWKRCIDLVANAKQVVSSVQDVALKLADYANFRRNKSPSVDPVGKELPIAREAPLPRKAAKENSVVVKIEETKPAVSEELFIPGSVYYLKRNLGSQNNVEKEVFTLLKRQPGEHFQRIILSGNFITDHRCDSHYYALRDVLKGLPWHGEEGIFR
ncbi:uncharacterized protein [Cicer arietinum]|uniref:Uncharacterized protein LOC101505526 isoform X3 n=1 Tax=Cicer arietinum TaxID=3827 RepID=A0A3Q7YF02_CICAR|nr:uncharacterized protein LOC101505526 isoform X3 [Cicer arietinum]